MLYELQDFVSGTGGMKLNVLLFIVLLHGAAAAVVSPTKWQTLSGTIMASFHLRVVIGHTKRLQGVKNVFFFLSMSQVMLLRS